MKLEDARAREPLAYPADCPAGVRIIDTPTELDTYSCASLRGLMVQLAAVPDCAAVVLAMAGTDYIDSAGLGTVVGGMRYLAERGKRLLLADVTADVATVFRIIGLVRMLDTALPLGQAIEAAQA